MTDERILQWLEAERSGRPDDAEALFSAVFTEQVPVLTPPAGFTERVLAARLAARESSPWTWRSVRLVGAAAAVLMGLLLPVLLTLDPFALVGSAAGAGAGLLGDVRAFWHAALAFGLTAWTLAASLGRAVLFASASGLVPFVLTANLILALASSYGLMRLMAPGEECP